MTDRDIRREMADEIASALQDASDRVNLRIHGLPTDEFWVYVGLARGYELAAEMAAKMGPKG